MAIQAEERAEVGQRARGMAEWLALHHTYNAILKETELALLPENLSLAQLRVLSVLKEAGDILSTGEISRAIGKTSQPITGLVDGLEDQELVQRHFDGRDRRKVWVRLTAKGLRKWEEAVRVANRLAEEVFSALTDGELRELQAHTDELQTVATKRLAEAPGRSRF